jgi:hypothetical protein
MYVKPIAMYCGFYFGWILRDFDERKKGGLYDQALTDTSAHKILKQSSNKVAGFTKSFNIRYFWIHLLHNTIIRRIMNQTFDYQVDHKSRYPTNRRRY